LWHYGEEVQCLMQYAEINAVYTTRLGALEFKCGAELKFG